MAIHLLIIILEYHTLHDIPCTQPLIRNQSQKENYTMVPSSPPTPSPFSSLIPFLFLQLFILIFYARFHFSIPVSLIPYIEASYISYTHIYTYVCMYVWDICIYVLYPLNLVHSYPIYFGWSNLDFKSI